MTLGSYLGGGRQLHQLDALGRDLQLLGAGHPRQIEPGEALAGPLHLLGER